MIDSYSFGRIVVEGRNYTSDIIIYPDDHIQDSWWRRSGHRLCIDDIKELIDIKPQMIIAGTGNPGLMKPEKELEMLLAENGIEFKVLPSKEAVKLYNQLCKERSIGACFHLTC